MNSRFGAAHAAPGANRTTARTTASIERMWVGPLRNRPILTTASAFADARANVLRGHSARQHQPLPGASRESWPGFARDLQGQHGQPLRAARQPAANRSDALMGAHAERRVGRAAPRRAGYSKPSRKMGGSGTTS